MSEISEIEQVMDRRRLKRRLQIWQSLVVILLLVIVVTQVIKGGEILRQEYVAQVNIEGVILNDNPMVELIESLAEDDKARALIVHVESPGGTVVGSESLYKAVRKVGETKPVVVTMGSVAASGGYIVALAGEQIFASSNSLTGSIGVVLRIPEFSGLLDKVGINYDEIKSSPLKAEPSGIKPMSKEARDWYQTTVLDTYDWFTNLVKTHRKMSPEELENVTDGRVFTGRQAVKNGLIDAIGGREKALEWLQKEKKIAPHLQIVLLKPPDEAPWEALFGSVTTFFSGQTLIPHINSVDGLLAIWNPSL